MSVLLQSVGNNANTNLSNITRTGVRNLSKLVSESDDVIARANRIATTTGDDVQIDPTPPTAGQFLLTSNATNCYWADYGGGGGTGVDYLHELLDCQIPSPLNNEILTYDSATSLWKAKPRAVINSTDVVETSPNLFISPGEVDKLNNVIIDNASIQLSNGSSTVGLEIDVGGRLVLNSDVNEPLIHNGGVIPMTIDGVAPGTDGDIPYASSNLAFHNKNIDYRNGNNIIVDNVALLTYEEPSEITPPLDGWTYQYVSATDHMVLSEPPTMTTQFVDLTDVATSNLQPNDLIYWSSLTSKYSNAQPATLNLVNTSSSQTLTNKTLDSATNDIRANKLLDIEIIANSNQIGHELKITSLSPLQCQFQAESIGTLSGLSDVSVTNPLGNYSEILAYNSVTGKWQNSDSVNDCNLVTVDGAQTLSNKTIDYNDGNTINANYLKDIEIQGVAVVGKVLTALSSTSAEFQAPATPFIALSQLTDCVITSVQNRDLLVWNSTEWVNSTLQTSDIPDLSSTYLTLSGSQAVSNKTITNSTINSGDNDVSANKINGVSITGIPSSGQIIQSINSTQASWQTLPSQNLALSGLTTDVNIVSPSDQQVLLYSTPSNKWINYTQAWITANSINNLSNKTISYTNNIISVDSLRGTQITNNPTAVGWALQSTSAGGLTCAWSALPAQALVALSDVLLTSLTINDFLIWNGLKWINTSVNNYVTLSTSQVLTNKDLTSNTNSIRATQIRDVIVSVTAPVAGQFLVATGSAAASWSDILDSSTTFADDADTTKRMQFQLSSIATATTRTLTVPNKSGTMAMLDDLVFGSPALFSLTNTVINTQYNISNFVDPTNGTIMYNTDTKAPIARSSYTLGVSNGDLFINRNSIAGGANISINYSNIIATKAVEIMHCLAGTSAFNLTGSGSTTITHGVSSNKYVVSTQLSGYYIVKGTTNIPILAIENDNTTARFQLTKYNFISSPNTVQNQVFKASATTNTFNLGYVNLSELADCNTTGLAANNILTYSGTAWVPRNYITLGTSNTITLGSFATDSFSISSVNASYAMLFVITSLLWQINLNNNKCQLYGSNGGAANGNSFNIQLDGNASDTFTLQGGASAGQATCSMNHYTTNTKFFKASSLFTSGIVQVSATTTYTVPGDGSVSIVIRTAGTGNTNHVMMPAVNLILAGNIGIGFRVRVYMTAGTSGQIQQNTLDTYTSYFNDTAAPINMAQKICREYILAYTSGLNAYWIYDN